MLYGGSCWSELPVSTSKPQQANGDVFRFNFLIDQILSGDYQIDQTLRTVAFIDQELNVNTMLGRVIEFKLPISRQNSFTLDPNDE
jgi:hypothetical protein